MLRRPEGTAPRWSRSRRGRSPGRGPRGRQDNIDNEEQTIHFPLIRTTATVSGSHRAKFSNEPVEIVDEVSYGNLTPGEKYTLTDEDTYNRLVRRIKGIATANLYGKSREIMHCLNAFIP